MPLDPASIGEIAIERKEDVLYLGIDCVVKALDRVGARGYASKRAVHLRHAFEMKSDVPLRQLRRTETELAPGDAIAGDRTLALQMVKIGAGALCELGVLDTVLEVKPDMVDCPLLLSHAGILCTVIGAMLWGNVHAWSQHCAGILALCHRNNFELD